MRGGRTLLCSAGMLVALAAPSAAPAAAPSVGEVANAGDIVHYTGHAGGELLTVRADRSTGIVDFANANGVILAGPGCTTAWTTARCTGTPTWLMLGIHLGQGDDRLDLFTLAQAGISGGPGADVIVSGGGNDDIRGGPGRDLLSGGAGNDLIVGDEPADAKLPDRIYGGSGDDFIDADDGVADLVDCGSGTDDGYADAIDTLVDCENLRDV